VLQLQREFRAVAMHARGEVGKSRNETIVGHRDLAAPPAARAS
jgi:hypothetical protein